MKARAATRQFLRLLRLEDRLAPAASLSLVSRTDPSMVSDTAGGASAVFYEPSLNTAGGIPNISSDGRFVVFVSEAENVISGQTDTNRTSDIFLHDRLNESTLLVSRAAGSATTAANSRSSFPSMSADGRYIAFASPATNLVANFTPSANGSENVYRFDRVTGQTTLVSHRFDSPTTGAAFSSNFSITAFGRPVMSGDGRFVAFNSDAPDIIAGFTPTSSTRSVFLYDAANNQSVLVNHKYGSATVASSSAATLGQVTPDGRYVSFSSNATDLLSTSTTSKGDAYRYDRLTGDSQLISRTSTTPPFGGNGATSAVGISADGRWVLLFTGATNLVPGATTSGSQLVLADAQAGTMTLVSHSAADPMVGADKSTFRVSISADGAFVAFGSQATNLVAGYVNTTSADRTNAYLFERATGKVTLVSRQYGTTNVSGNNLFGVPLEISADGRYLVFLEGGTDVMPGFVDRNGAGGYDYYRYDRISGQTILLSGKAGSATEGGNGQNLNQGVVNADCTVVAFVSGASDLAVGIVDTNNLDDVYVRDVAAGTTEVVSRRFGSPSQSPGGKTEWVQQSADGRFIVYASSAINLVPGQVDGPNSQDIFLFDRQTQVTTLVSHAHDSPFTAASGPNITDYGQTYLGYSYFPVISGDGRFVVYSSNAGNLVPGFVDGNGAPVPGFATDLFLYDRVTNTNVLVSRQAGTTNVGGNSDSGHVSQRKDFIPAISDDGRYVVYSSLASDLVSGLIDNNGQAFGGSVTGYDVYVFDRVTGTNRLVSHQPGQPLATGNNASFAPRLSGDGRFITFHSGASGLMAGQTGGGLHVYLYDQQTDTIVLVSHAEGSPTTSANGGSNYANISQDGNFIVYQSTSNTLVTGQDPNNATDVFLYDRVAGTNTLVSHRHDSATIAGNRTSDLTIGDAGYANFVSADGRYVVYTSGAGDLVDGFIDNNGQDSIASTNKGDVFVFDRLTGENNLVSRSVTSSLQGGNGSSTVPSISRDGRFITFGGSATDLVSPAVFTPGPSRLYLFDRKLNTTALVNQSTVGANIGGNGESYVPSINQDGSSIVFWSSARNLVVGDFNNFADAFAYVTPPPTVTSIQINDGTPQRSIVKSLTVTFDQPVFFAADPAASFTLTRNDQPGTPVALAASVTTDATTTVTLTFAGSMTEAGSLSDGNYTLSIDAAQVTNIAALDGNGDGTPGDHFVSAPGAIFRLLGDGNGDRRVDLVDFIALRFALWTDPSSANWNEGFDLNGDGFIDVRDFLAFRGRLGMFV